MKKITFLSAILLASYTFLNAQNGVNYPEGFTPQSNSLVNFKENKGQVSDQNYKPRPDVLFSGTDGKMVYHLKKNGVSYQLSRIDSWKEMEDGKPKDAMPGIEKQKVPDQTTIFRLDVNWLYSNTNTTILTGAAQQGVDNYYTAVCPDGILGVKSFNDVTYQNIYSNINLKWYSKDGSLKYDYIVSPGGDYKQIQLQFEGAESLTINANGELVIKTPLGELVEQAPLVNQNGKTLPSKWVIKNNVVSFEIENIDAQKEFIIDPAVRVWGTYYGGTGNEYGNSCSVDVLGNVYLAGETGSTSAIATVGAHQTVLSNYDAFLVKFNSGGVRQWGTYYGGTSGDTGYSCATDASGNVYLAGTTNSTSAIATSGGHQTVFGGGSYDGFLVQFNSTGVRQWGTYYGGANYEEGYSCTTDALGNVYLTGYTGSTSAIATSGAHQTVSGGNYDAFLVKFNSSGVRQWGTYYGGMGDDRGQSCATDNFGNVYLAGLTQSGSAIATVGAYQTFFSGIVNAFLIKFNSNGVRQWGTYYGGTGQDYGHFCATDGSGNVYLAGYATSTNAIATVGAHQTVLGGSYDAFLAKFNSSGMRQWGTYYGGASTDFGFSCTTDTSGNIYMAGWSNSISSIATSGAHQTVFGGGSYDAFFVKFNTNGIRQWGTYYGGANVDEGYSCAADASGNVYMIGYTNSTSTIATVGAHQPFIGGNYDAFLFQFYEAQPLTATQSQIDLTCNSVCNGSATVVASLGTAPYTYSWSPSGGNAATASSLCAGSYSCTITDAASVSITQSFIITQPSLLIANSSSTAIACNGGNSTITVVGSGGTSPYTGEGTFTVTAGTYSYTVTDANGCTSNTSITITQPALLTANSSASSVLCNGGNSTITVVGSGGTSPYTGDGTFTVTAGNYSYTITDANGCTSTTSITVTEPTAISSVITQINVSCFGGNDGSIDLTVSGGTSPYTFDWNSGLYTTEDLSGLSAGSFVGVLTDANGCTDGGTIIITEPLLLVASMITTVDPSTCAGTDGSIDISITGGTPGYSCLWNNAATTEDLSAIGAGTYNCTVTDTNGCTTQIGSSLTDPNAPVVTLTLAVDTVCTTDAPFTLSGGFPAGGTFSGPGVSAGSFDPSTANAGANTITYSFTDIATNCSASNTAVIYVDVCAGISTISSLPTPFSIMPNPNNGTFMLYLNTTTNADVKIYDALGQLVSSQKVQPNVQQELSIVNSGVYMISVVTADGQRMSKRVVVSR